jgi:hypothetical protein
MLKERGNQQFITNDTLDEFLALMLDYYTKKTIKKQFKLFKKLWHRPLFKMFHDDELNILVSGREIVNWQALRVIREGQARIAQVHHLNQHRAAWRRSQNHLTALCRSHKAARCLHLLQPSEFTRLFENGHVAPEHEDLNR